MNKKKVIWGVALFAFIAITVWLSIPYFFQSKNLISRYNYEYTYKQARFRDYDKLENSTHINNDESSKVDKIISVIDDLSFNKTWKPNGWPNYGISFVATYKEGVSSIYTQEVFSIRFYKGNIIAFREKPQYREVYYEIQNEYFDIKKVIEMLQKSKD